ncbi:MAG: DUF3093 domain-containing protein [Actinobacteria bacterium]|nr:DUF3093 domain-containing protein [Actinomycetota bacterium]
MEAKKELRVLFTEQVRPPLWLLAFIFFLLASVALSIWAAFDNPAGLITLGIGVVLLFLIRQSMTMTILLSASELRIGRAHIDRIYLGEITELSTEEMRLTRGRNADPAAFLAIRFWEPHGVRIRVEDPRDPTPYWLISLKNAKGLVEALELRAEKK